MDEMVEEAREYARTDVKDVLFFISRASSFDDDGKMLRAYRVGIEPFIVSSSKA